MAQTLRKKIALEAARLICHEHISEYSKAKMRAARKSIRGEICQTELPSHREIHAEVKRLKKILPQVAFHADKLLETCSVALVLMNTLKKFKPRLESEILLGSGPSEQRSVIHVMSQNLEEVLFQLAKSTTKVKTTHLKHFAGAQYGACSALLEINQGAVMLVAVYPSMRAYDNQQSENFKQHRPSASIEDVEKLLEHHYPEYPLEAGEEQRNRLDQFVVYEQLLLPLQEIYSYDDRERGGLDLLTQSLQLFAYVCHTFPYDEELQLAALLYQVGAAVTSPGASPQEVADATIKLLAQQVTVRTCALIEHLPAAVALRKKKLGVKAARRLKELPDYEELSTMARGVLMIQTDPFPETLELEEALQLLREFDFSFES